MRILRATRAMCALSALHASARLLVPAITACVLSLAASAQDAAAPVRIGVLAYKGDTEMSLDWAYLARWLELRIPSRRFHLQPYDQAELTSAVRSSNVDFILTNSGHYVALEHSDGASRIATLESPGSPAPGRSLGSAIVVRTGAPLQTLTDLSGKHVTAVGADAFGGYLIAARELLQAGIDPGRDFGKLTFSGFPMQNIVHAVRNGQADAGIVRVCLLEELIRRGDVAPHELRVLAPMVTPGFQCQTSSRLYPDWPIATLPHTSAELSKQVALALLSMPRTADGYSWSVPGDYQSVDELFRELQIGPYANLRDWTLESLARRYWGWLLCAAGVLAAWTAHTIRVRYLINERTRELHDAQAEQLRMAEDARQRQATLDHTARLAILGEMAGAIAHELNQPLAAIRNFAHGISRRVAGGRMDPQPLLDGANEIAQQSERAADIIRNIRAFARKNLSEQMRFDLLPAVDEAVTMFVAAHPQAHPVWIAVPPACPTPVLGDPVHIQQVVLNLLKNAWDAQRVAGRAHDPIELRFVESDEGWRIEIRDCGCGVPPEQFARLFEPFFTTKQEGLGLGLSLSKRIVESVGGTLSARPNDDRHGLTVWFALPRQDHEAAPDMRGQLPAPIDQPATRQA